MQFGQHKGQNPSPQGAQASQAFCLTPLYARLGEFRRKKPPLFRLHARQRKKACGVLLAVRVIWGALLFAYFASPSADPLWA